ncbi:MAG: T9SS type A sorting domain-containing protein [Bacteroidales bacterium]|nr:T9SS type A sorting domain-containing protein [Bacteroidales bacterium]
MKFIKTMLLSGLLLGSAGWTLAQQEINLNNRVVEGGKGKAIFLEGTGAGSGSLSRNEKYVYGDFGESEAGFIYSIEEDKFMLYTGYGIVAVNDFNNYVATTHMVRNGQRVDFKLQGLGASGVGYGATGASADMSVISYDTHIDGLYVTVLLDGEGNIIDTMPHLDVNLTPGYGSFALAMTDDFSVLVGRSSLTRAFSNFTPAIWDRDADKIIGTIIEDPVSPGAQNLSNKLDGTLYGVNEDGTMAVGEMGDQACWIKYNREDQTYTVDFFEPLPNYGSGYSNQIKSGVIQGVDMVSMLERAPWFYYIETGEKVSVNDVLLYLYDLDLSATPYEQPLFTTISFSKDMRTLSGYTYDNGAYFPYVILLDAEQVHPIARNVSARQQYQTANVEIQWDMPLKFNSPYTLDGFNVYRDGEKIASVKAGELKYTDYAVQPGEHNYQVEASYTDGIGSKLSAENNILVVGTEGDCLPVQDLTADLVYNRTVNLFWGLPSADIASMPAKRSSSMQREADSRISLAAAPKAGNAPKYQAEGQLDFVSLMNMQSQMTSAAVRVGNYLYVSHFREGTIFMFNALTGQLISSVKISGLPGLYDMTYHDNTLYGVGNTKFFYEISINPNDPTDISLANSWPAKSQLTHIAYLEGLNDGKDMILTGNYNELLFYNTNPADANDLVEGVAERFKLNGETIIGSAYHNGRLYFANQHDGNSSLIETYDWKTGEYLFTTNLLSYPAVDEVVFASSGYSALAAGLSVGELEDGTVVLDAMIQPLVDYNQVVTVEIESSPSVGGYNIYRDGEKINSAVVQARHYSEELLVPGTYEYQIEFIDANGNSSFTNYKKYSATATVTVTEIGECEPPTKVDVFETNEWAYLSWDLPVSTDGFVGFNVYRNNEKAGSFLVADITNHYIDKDLEKGKTYVYKVEAFYDNSCVASDSVELVPTFEGTAEAPSAIRADVKKDGADAYDITLSWELPYFETPMSLGYCSVPAGAVTLDGSDVIYAMIGWDENDLLTYEDLYLIGVEFFLGTDVKTVGGVVYINGQQVLNEPIDRVRVQEWHQHYFSKSFSMKQNMVDVGYVVSFVPEELTGDVLVYDFGPAKAGYSDQVSPDGVTVYSLVASGVDANLCINALVVRKRDMEQAAKMPDAQEYLKTKAFSLASVELKGQTPVKAAKSTSERYTLKGFNVYRDDEKLNESMLTNFSFVDGGIAEGGYEYVVSAVYADQEVESESMYVIVEDLANGQDQAVCPVAFRPNPVKDVLYIDGEYATLSLIDITGRVVVSEVRNVKSLPMDKCQSGIYFVKLTLENGQSYITKIVKK